MSQYFAEHWVVTPLRQGRGVPKGGCRGAAPPKPQNRNLKNTDFVDMISNALRDFLFSRNQQLKLAYDQYIRILKNVLTKLMTWAGHVARMRERRRAYKILVGRPEGRQPLGKPRHRWEDNIKWIFKLWDGALTGLSWLRIGTGGGFL
jgi:hypothetical protein